jgi:hypothetical protein
MKKYFVLLSVLICNAASAGVVTVIVEGEGCNPLIREKLKMRQQELAQKICNGIAYVQPILESEACFRTGNELSFSGSASFRCIRAF